MRLLPMLMILVLAAACTPDREIPGVPEALHREAVVPGYPATIRFWGDETPPAFAEAMALQRAALIREREIVPDQPLEIAILLLSGGGSDGAFGAGILNGWSERGDRPVFQLVTGISTGAIIAPFAFLGTEYDPVLREIYTETATDQLVTLNPLKALFGRSLGLADTTPLANRIAQLVTPDFVAQIAEEHANGRLLLIGTTNLDAQRSVIWNIGEIAATGRPDAPALIQKIILASAAIPGAFPPVLIEVEAGGETYSEVHVDGGVTRQLFLLPLRTDGGTVRRASERTPISGTIYAIRNTKIDPSYEPTELGLGDIAGRSVSTMIRTAGQADVLVIGAQAEAVGMDLRIAFVPAAFDGVENEMFDPVYMGALYKIGYDAARAGYPWAETLER